MGTYIVLGNYTDQGIRNIKQSPRRLTAAKNVLKEMGGRLRNFYLTMGAIDIVVVIEAPSDEVATQFVLAVGSLGNVRTTTLKAFPEPDFRKIVKSIS